MINDKMDDDDDNNNDTKWEVGESDDISYRHIYHEPYGFWY